MDQLPSKTERNRQETNSRTTQLGEKVNSYRCRKKKKQIKIIKTKQENPTLACFTGRAKLHLEVQAAKQLGRNCFINASSGALPASQHSPGARGVLLSNGRGKLCLFKRARQERGREKKLN